LYVHKSSLCILTLFQDENLNMMMINAIKAAIYAPLIKSPVEILEFLLNRFINLILPWLYGGYLALSRSIDDFSKTGFIWEH